jgi:hypothetical protein
MFLLLLFFCGRGFDESGCPRLFFIKVGLNTRAGLLKFASPYISIGLNEDPRIVAARDRGHQIETHGYSIWDGNQ